MPPAQRRQHLAVVSQLLADPQRYGFFQALRLLERWLHREEGLTSQQVFATRIAMHNSLSLAFPASEIEALTVVRVVDAVDAGDAADGSVGQAVAELAAGGGTPGDVLAITGSDGVPRSAALARIDVTPAFISLLGASGAMPSYYTEVIAEREVLNRDHMARAFLDIFLHRASVLFYGAWGKHRLPVQYEADRQQRYLPLVLSVAGVGQAGLRQRLRPQEGGVADEALAYFAGALQQRPCSAVMLQRVLQQYLGVDVQLEQFVGRWFDLPAANQSHLGLKNMEWGSLVMGQRVWQRDLRIRLTLGPMARDKFRRFLPGGPGALALRELLELLTHSLLESEVRLRLRAQDVRGVTLAAGEPALLGWDSFLVGSDGVAEDRSDVAYDLLALA